MTFPALVLSNGCCKALPHPAQSEAGTCIRVIIASLIVLDSVVFISALALGILSYLSTITLPVAATYASFGTCAGIALFWFTLFIATCLKGKNT